jgi:hypothetical protein
MEEKQDSTNQSKGARLSLLFGGSKKRWQVLSIVVILVLGLAGHRLTARSDEGPGTVDTTFQSPLIWKFPLGEHTPIPTGVMTPGDLLTNGNMDQMGFYWRPPNHWIAGAWFEWFSTKPYNFPEFNDGYERGFYHTWPSSQRLQLWGDDFAGGLMQSATVVPCVTYRFEAYGQSRPGNPPVPPVPVQSHMKVGIEPYGWMSGRSINDYDPGLEPEAFPDTVVWSAEATHNFVFMPYTVTAEALANTVTVIMYSYPEVDVEGGVVWNDAIWDTASLVEVPPPSGTLLEDDQVPAPDGFITSLTAVASSEETVVAWDTPVAASTQLLYRTLEPSEPISGTTLLPYSLYVPMAGTAIYWQHSPLDTTPVLHHRVALSGLPAGTVLDFVALSRRLEGNACVTSASVRTQVTSSNGVQ